jgi:hypothetical protein
LSDAKEVRVLLWRSKQNCSDFEKWRPPGKYERGDKSAAFDCRLGIATCPDFDCVVFASEGEKGGPIQENVLTITIDAQVVRPKL